MKKLVLLLCWFGLCATHAQSQTIKLSCSGQVDRSTRELNGELKPANQGLFFEKFFITPVVNKKGATTGFMLESEMTGKWVNKNTTQVLAKGLTKPLKELIINDTVSVEFKQDMLLASNHNNQAYRLTEGDDRLHFYRITTLITVDLKNGEIRIDQDAVDSDFASDRTNFYHRYTGECLVSGQL